MEPPPPVHRHYRPKQYETPSYGAGIDHNAEDRVRNSSKKHKHTSSGVHVYSDKSSSKYNNDWKELQKGIENDDDEWEAPAPLQTPHRTPLLTPSRRSGNQTPSRDIKLGRGTPYRESTNKQTNSSIHPMYTSKSYTSGLLNDDDFNNQISYGDNLQDDDFDREFYETEEGVQSENIDSYFIGDSKKWAEKEENYQKQFENESNKHVSAYKSEFFRDREKWESDRMVTAGMKKATNNDDYYSLDESRVSILVQDIKPPFLDSDVILSKQIEMVSTVKDPTSSFARYAKQGSETLKNMLTEKEQNTSRDRFWELSGTKMGDIMHVRDVRKERDKKLDTEEEETQDSEKITKQLEEDINQEGSSEFSRTKSIQQQREYLPIYSVRDELLQIIRENQVIIVVGETGCGKTTQLPQYLYEDGYAERGIIGCTQPRRVAATSVALRVCKEMDCKLKTKVGYAIRFEDQTSKETKIKYMTDGILLKESLNDKVLQKYSCVIMDEAHERSLNTDVLFGIFKKILRQRRDLKLIVTSATMNAERFSNFFGEAPIFNVKGRTFPVDIYYSKAPEQDYIAAVVKQVLEIHFGFPSGDILVFMTGQADIECVCETVQKRLNELPPTSKKLVLLPMYSQLSADKQALIFHKYNDDTRKCIVCTNVAETSVTVDGIKYVIDSGYCKLKVFNPTIGMDALQVTPISQANANQRMGRAGRTESGSCFRMYTKNQYMTELLPNQIPEIQRTNLSSVVLLLKSLGIKNLLAFDFMDPPPQSNLQRSMYQLWVLGALDNIGELTPLGRKMVEFPLDASLSKMLIISEQMGCVAETLIIVAMLSVPNIFFRPNDRAEESDSIREKFFIPESDHLTYLNVYKQWKLNSCSENWCEKNYIHAKSMKKAKEIYSQLLLMCKQLHMNVSSCGEDWDVVRKTICSAYFMNAAQIKGVNDYVNMLNGTPCCIHPSSALFGLGYIPDYVVYHELVMTTKQYMQCVTAVEPQWLADMGPMFFSIKENYAKRLLNKNKTEELRKQMDADQQKQKELLKQEHEQEQNKFMPRTVPGLCTPGLTKRPIRDTPRPKKAWKTYDENN